MSTSGKKKTYQNLKEYEVIKDFKHIEFNHSSKTDKTEFELTYIILCTGYTSRLLIGAERRTELKRIMKEHGVKLTLIWDEVWGRGEPLMLFEQGLNTEERPNKLDYLLKLCSRDSVIFRVIDYSKCDSMSLAREILDLDYCAHFSMESSIMYRNIFNEKKVNMDHRYFADVLIALDNIFPKTISNIIDKYCDHLEDTGQHALVIKWDAESG